MTVETATLPRECGEASPDYARTVHVHGKHRVVLCRHGLQWVIQRADDKRLSRWRGLRFCQTRRALLRDWDEITQGAHRGALEYLLERAALEGV